MARKQTKNIYKRKDGRWEGRYYTIEGGKKKYHSVYGKSKAEVEAILEEKRKIIALETNQLQISEIAEFFLAEKKKCLKPNSYVTYVHYVNDIIVPYFGKYKPIEVDRGLMRKFSKFLEKKYSQNVKREILFFANSVIKFPENMDSFFEEKILLELNILSGKEIDNLIEYLETSDYVTNLIIRMILFSGMKIGELCALRWEDFDQKKNEICINKTIQRVKDDPHDKTSKTSLIILPIEERRIPIHPSLRKYIAHKTGYVLTNSEKPMEIRSAQYRLKTICKSAKISDITFTDLRDTFAVTALNCEMSKNVLASILGVSIEKIEKYLPYVCYQEDPQSEMKKVCF